MKNIKTKENTEEKVQETEKAEVSNKKSLPLVLSVASAILVLVMFGFMELKIHGLQSQINAQQQQIENSKKVYVYNLEDVLKGTDIIAVKQKFEDEIIKLNDEVFATEKKIKSIQDAKMKKELSDMYLKNLKMKRDDLMAKYQNDVKELTDKVNTAVGKIAEEKNVSVIFVKNAIAVKTPQVIDVTPEVLAKITNK